MCILFVHSDLRAEADDEATSDWSEGKVYILFCQIIILNFIIIYYYILLLSYFYQHLLSFSFILIYFLAFQTRQKFHFLEQDCRDQETHPLLSMTWPTGHQRRRVVATHVQTHVLWHVQQHVLPRHHLQLVRKSLFVAGYV